MKILIHDYTGSLFQVQLSRALAARGHEAVHAFATLGQRPGGELAPKAGDVATLRLQPVEMGAEDGRSEGSFLRRRRLEVAYGRRVAALIAVERPDVVVSSNTPTEAQGPMVRACRKQGAAFHFWVQDFSSRALGRVQRPKLPLVGALAGAYHRWVDGVQLRGAAGVVAITEDSAMILKRDFGVERSRVTTIPNWAPLESVPVRPKRNAWSEAHGLADKFVYLHIGTLGLRENPRLLLELARRHRDNGSVRVVVVNEGPGAEWLQAQTAADPLPGLIQMPCQKLSVMPEVLASGDVLLALLEEDAGVFSMPSKVLTYLCAERPVLLAAPSLHPAIRLVARERVGMTCAPGDVGAFLEAADHLRTQVGLGAVMGRRARAFAERAFQIETIADQFERALGLAPALRLPALPSGEAWGAACVAPPAAFQTVVA